MIHKLNRELSDVEAAQAGLDRFPNCFAPTALPKAHGPPSKPQLDAEKKAERDRQLALDKEVEEHFSFVKQRFIGPMTRDQARKDKLLREQLVEGDPDIDFDFLLATENMNLLMEREMKMRKGGAKKSYEQVRMDKEKAKIAAILDAAPPKKAVAPRTRAGPLTQAEWIATLPKAGPETMAEALFPAQREQRHHILNWMKRPWPVWDKQAAPMMQRLGRLAVRKMEVETKKEKKAKEKEAAPAPAKETEAAQAKEKEAAEEKEKDRAATKAQETEAAEPEEKEKGEKGKADKEESD